MLLTYKNIRNVLVMAFVMALTIFAMRGFQSETELTLINLVPYLFSSFCGAILVFLYLYLFPSQRKDNFLTFLIPGIALLTLLLSTGVADLWLIDDLMLFLVFVFGGQEVSKP